MLTFDVIFLFRDVGYSCQDRTVPPIFSTKLPQATYQFENVRMQKTGIAYRVDVPIPYTQAIEMTYIEAYTTQTDPFSWYGWIRRVEQIAGQSDACTIEWEIDYWRTYQHRLEFNSGTITQIDEATADSLQAFSAYDIQQPPIEQQQLYNIMNENYDYAFMIFTYMLSGEHFIGVTPISNKIENWIPSHDDRLSPMISSTEDPSALTSIATLSFDFIDSFFNHQGIDVNNITGCWLSPVFPFPEMIMGYYNNGKTIQINQNSQNFVNVPIVQQYPFFRFAKLNFESYYLSSQNQNDVSNYYTLDVPQNLTFSNDEKNIFVLNQFRSKQYKLPYIDDTITSIRYRLNITLTSQEIQIYFATDSVSDFDSCECNDRQVHFPLVTLPVTQSQLSNYVYSGQRDADRNSINIQFETSIKSSLLHAGESAIGGAVAGAIGGAGIGAIGGAIAGQAIGGLSDYFGTEIERDKATRIQFQKENVLQNQSVSIINPDNFQQLREYPLNCFYSFGVYEGNNTFKNERANRIANFGKKLNYTFGSDFAQTVKNYLQLWDGANSRPIQIVNVSCYGQQPIDAINKIKEKLEAGVYIIEKN